MPGTVLALSFLGGVGVGGVGVQSGNVVEDMKPLPHSHCRAVAATVSQTDVSSRYFPPHTVALIPLPELRGSCGWEACWVVCPDFHGILGHTQGPRWSWAALRPHSVMLSLPAMPLVMVTMRKSCW